MEPPVVPDGEVTSAGAAHRAVSLSDVETARRASVLAYCARLCDPASIAEAADAAFAQFRTVLEAAGADQVVDLDRALLEATRDAAAEHIEPPTAAGLVPRRSSATCRVMPTLLTARASGRLGSADLERVDRHLSRCARCRTLENRREEAEQAYAALLGAPVPGAVGAAEPEEPFAPGDPEPEVLATRPIGVVVDDDAAEAHAGDGDDEPAHEEAADSAEPDPGAATTVAPMHEESAASPEPEPEAATTVAPVHEGTADGAEPETPTTVRPVRDEVPGGGERVDEEAIERPELARPDGVDDADNAPDAPPEDPEPATEVAVAEEQYAGAQPDAEPERFELAAPAEDGTAEHEPSVAFSGWSDPADETRGSRRGRYAIAAILALGVVIFAVGLVQLLSGDDGSETTAPPARPAAQSQAAEPAPAPAATPGPSRAQVRTRARLRALGDRELGPGTTGADVKALQKLLGVQQTGNYGELTAFAVGQFQATHGLPSTGVADEATKRKLARRRRPPATAPAPPAADAPAPDTGTTAPPAGSGGAEAPAPPGAGTTPPPSTGQATTPPASPGQ